MKKIPSQISVGTDMEVFLWDNEKNKVAPCVGILPGTKENPHQFDDLPKGFWVQEDNVMVEFNIPPATNHNMFSRAVKTAKRRVLEELEARYNGKYSLYLGSSSHKFAAKDLASTQAQTIGCEPDFEAYSGGKMRTNPPTPGLERSCGGHIHIGGDFKCPDFVAALYMELFMAIRCSIRPHPGDPRLAWYGQPGLYRPKPYGIEYRTPSNHWFAAGYAPTVAESSLRCAKFLTENSAITLSNAFRRIPWLKLKEYLLTDNGSEHATDLYQEVYAAAKGAGVPL